MLNGHFFYNCVIQRLTENLNIRSSRMLHSVDW
jgi:hypothetical protein